MKTAGEKQITIAAKLYECRATMRSFWKERYEAKIADYSDLLKKIMVKRKVGCLEAGLIACEILEASEVANKSPISLALLLAASVEMAEREIRPSGA